MLPAAPLIPVATSDGWPRLDAVPELALYRKYRSATFGEVIGQDHVTGPLTQALKSGRINHAYLFSGPRGCGKTSSARILARSLNCVQGPTPTPCGICDSCVELAPNGPGSIDVIEIDAASHGGVDDARDLRERAFYAPVRDRYKVYIVDEAHMVTTQGFNALLKLIEEPPDFLVFVFATTEPDKVLPTIRSRTHHYPFRLVPPGVLRSHLEQICEAEGVGVEPAVLPLVVRAGGGSVRDALSVLDQLFAGTGDAGVTYAQAVGLLGVTDAALLDDIVDALAAGDAAGVYGTVDRVVEAGHDPRRFAADLLDRFRDLIVLDAVPDAGERGLLDCPEDTLRRMADQVARLGGATVTRYAEIVHNALIEMRGTTSPRLVLELLCARMQLPDASTDAAALLQRVERLERGQALAQTNRAPAPTGPPQVEEPTAPEAAPAKLAKPATPPKPATPTATPTATPPPATPTSGPIDAVGLRQIWPEVLDAAKRIRQRTRALLLEAQVLAVDGELITLGAPSAPLARMISEESNLEVLRTALGEVVPGRWQVEVRTGEDGGPGRTPTATADHGSTRPRVKAPDEADPRDDSEPPNPPASPVDPEAEALRLLHATLGARPVDDG